jgi:hypothetical protein
VTAHAGEWSGAENIRYAIEQLGAVRIGHGVRILDDPSLVALARERAITFEICPTSNLCSGVVSSLDQHPLRQMHQLGLRVTLNTDDPLLCNCTLSDEFYNAWHSAWLCAARAAPDDAARRRSRLFAARRTRRPDRAPACPLTTRCCTAQREPLHWQPLRSSAFSIIARSYGFLARSALARHR